jgi:hypothetical protein
MRQICDGEYKPVLRENVRRLTIRLCFWNPAWAPARAGGGSKSTHKVFKMPGGYSNKEAAPEKGTSGASTMRRGLKAIRPDALRLNEPPGPVAVARGRHAPSAS